MRLRASLHVVAKTKIPAPLKIQSRTRRSWLTQHRLSYAVHVTRDSCTVAYIGLYEVSVASAQVKTKRNAIGSHCVTAEIAGHYRITGRHLPCSKHALSHSQAPGRSAGTSRLQEPTSVEEVAVCRKSAGTENVVWTNMRPLQNLVQQKS